MQYYGIVTEIKAKHKSGVYGRVKLGNESSDYVESPALGSDLIDGSSITAGIIAGAKIGSRGGLYGTAIGAVAGAAIGAGIGAGIGGLDHIWSGKKDAIKLQHPNTTKRQLEIQHDLLDGQYDIPNELLYGLLDNLDSSTFKTLMKSGGGSNLTILERKDARLQFKHAGGPNGKFSEGIYIPHPKNETILIPLNGSTKLIEDIILAETIRTYVALGAKSIIIEDLTSIDAEVGGNKNGVKASGDVHYKKEVLREMHYAKSKFDVKKAEADKWFIADIPQIMEVIENRKEHNQLSEQFTSTIQLNVGINLDVLNIFGAKANFSTERTWSFKVKFYDKNEL